MMNCNNELNNLIVPYVKNKLSKSEVDKVEEHLTGCSECKEEARILKNLLPQFPDENIPHIPIELLVSYQIGKLEPGDNLLTDKTTQQIERHLESCESCSSELRIVESVEVEHEKAKSKIESIRDYEKIESEQENPVQVVLQYLKRSLSNLMLPQYVRNPYRIGIAVAALLVITFVIQTNSRWHELDLGLDTARVYKGDLMYTATRGNDSDPFETSRSAALAFLGQKLYYNDSTNKFQISDEFSNPAIHSPTIEYEIRILSKAGNFENQFTASIPKNNKIKSDDVEVWVLTLPSRTLMSAKLLEARISLELGKTQDELLCAVVTYKSDSSYFYATSFILELIK